MAVKKFEDEKKINDRLITVRNCVEAVFEGNLSDAEEALHLLHLDESEFYTLTFLKEPNVYSSFLMACAERSKNISGNKSASNKEEQSLVYSTIIKYDISFDKLLYTDSEDAFLMKYALLDLKKFQKCTETEKAGKVRKIIKKYRKLTDYERELLTYKAELLGITLEENGEIDFVSTFEKIKESSASNPAANKILAEMYIKGIGTAPNLEKAIECQKIAIANIGGYKKEKRKKKKEVAENKRLFLEALEYINLAKLQVNSDKPGDNEAESYKQAEERLCELLHKCFTDKYTLPLAAMYVQLYCDCIKANKFDDAKNYYDRFFALCMVLGEEKTKLYLECFEEITDLFKIRAKLFYILTKIHKNKKNVVNQTNSDASPANTLGNVKFNFDNDISGNETKDFDFKINTTPNCEDNAILSNPTLQKTDYVASLYSQASMFRAAMNCCNDDLRKAEYLYALGNTDEAKKLFEELYKSSSDEQTTTAPCDTKDLPLFITDIKFILVNTVYANCSRKKHSLLKLLNEQYEKKDADGKCHKVEAIEQML